MSEKDRHLDEQRIILSLVDENDLNPLEREHLKVCSHCLASRDLLATQLHGLSREASRWTPSPRRKAVLPASDTERGTAWTGRWYVGLATAAACAALIIALSWPHLFTGNVRPYGDVTLASETAADTRLMAEAGNLEDNSLPESLQAFVPDYGFPDDDDDFQGFVVPGDA
jgi:hypothetical protein